MFFVTMTDKFLSGWGGASGRIAKFVIVCETIEQAETIERNARKRSEMKNVSICTKRPNYSAKRYQTTFQAFDNLGSIWKA